MDDPSTVVTTSDEVLDLFRTAHARRSFDNWLGDPRRAGVIPVVLAHESRHIYRVTSADVIALRTRIAEDTRTRYPRGMQTDPVPAATRDPEALHPLTVIQKYQRQHKGPRDWSPPLSFNHAFHILLERRRGELFTYPQFAAACATDDGILKPLLWAYAKDLEKKAMPFASATAEQSFRNSLRWRMGCAYYGFLKEVYTIALLREHSINVRLHPLADTLFRTDFWTTTGWAVGLYVKNPTFADEDGLTGRKEKMLPFIKGLFAPELMELDTPTKFGSVVLPDEGRIAKLGWSISVIAPERRRPTS